MTDATLPPQRAVTVEEALRAVFLRPFDTLVRRWNWKTALFSAAFIVTILALVATVFGDEQAPLARWLDRHVGWLLAGEVVAILVTGFLALAVDRRATLREQQTGAPPAESKPDLRQEDH